jgi:hypothetical protein
MEQGRNLARSATNYLKKARNRKKPTLSQGPSHLKFDPDEGFGTRISKLRGERPGIPALGFRLLYALCSPL